MLKLYKFVDSNTGMVEPSAPCLKVESFLRMMEIPYESVAGMGVLKQAPKKKLPFIDDDGTIVPDSSFILRYLVDKHGDKLDGHLSAEQKAVSYAFMKMCDENLYWVLVYMRWAIDENWQVLKGMFFGGLSFPLNKIVPPIVRKGPIKSLYGHGLGRMSHEEIKEIANCDMAALSGQLGDKQWFHGDQLSSLDACAYAILVQFVENQMPNRTLSDQVKEYPNLVDFVGRFKAKYFA